MIVEGLSKSKVHTNHKPKTSKPFNGKCYIHLKLTPEDWCDYKGSCRIDQLALHNGTCNSCQYKKPINIPVLLEKLHNERNGEKTVAGI